MKEAVVVVALAQIACSPQERTDVEAVASFHIASSQWSGYLQTGNGAAPSPPLMQLLPLTADR